MSTKSGSTGRSGSFIERARRAQILDAATQVVAEVGYAHVSLSRIAEEADISKSVISYHFSGGKDEILRLVASQFFEQTWEHMESRIAEATTAAGRVRAWIGSQLEYFAAHRSEFLAMSDIVVNHRAPDGSRPLMDAEAEEVDGLAEILTEGQRDGDFRAFDPRRVANIVLRCTDGVLGSWAMDDGVDLTEESTVLLEFIDHAIRGEQR